MIERPDELACLHCAGHIIVNSEFFFVSSVKVRQESDGYLTEEADVPLGAYPKDCMTAALLAGGVAELVSAGFKNITLADIRAHAEYADHDLELIDILLATKKIDEALIQRAIKHDESELSNDTLYVVAGTVSDALEAVKQGNWAVL